MDTEKTMLKDLFPYHEGKNIEVNNLEFLNETRNKILDGLIMFFSLFGDVRIIDWGDGNVSANYGNLILRPTKEVRVEQMPLLMGKLVAGRRVQDEVYSIIKTVICDMKTLYSDKYFIVFESCIDYDGKIDNIIIKFGWHRSA